MLLQMMSFLDQNYNVLILRTCINHVWCPVLRAEQLSMPRLVKLKGHASFFSQWPETGTHLHSLLSHSDDTASLSVEKGMCVVRTHTSEVVCCMCVHVIPVQWFIFGEECAESLVHFYLKPPIQAAKGTTQNVFPTQLLCKRPQNNVSVF